MAIEKLPLVLSVGLPRSGSTWAFNVVMECLRRGCGGIAVEGIYANDVTEDVVDRISNVQGFVIKSHVPSTAWRLLLRTGCAPCILTLRSPHDCVLSLMETFRYSFRESVEIVRQSSLCLAPFVEGGNCLVLRYEDNFTGDLRTVYRIAEWLDRGLADDVVAEIFDSLTPLRVRQRLNDLVREAVFAGEDTRTEIEPGTNWHFDHLGEGTVGRSLARFDRGHLIAIDYALREVLPVLGYSAVTAPDIVEPGMEISFREGGLGAGYLGEGFGALEHWGVDGCRYSTDLASFADLDRASDFSSFDVASVSCIDEDLNRGSENPYQRSPGGNDRSRR